MVIDIQIQPEGGTRIMFDCRKAKPSPEEERRIEQAIARSLAAARMAAPQQINGRARIGVLVVPAVPDAPAIVQPAESAERDPRLEGNDRSHC